MNTPQEQTITVLLRTLSRAHTMAMKQSLTTDASQYLNQLPLAPRLRRVEVTGYHGTAAVEGQPRVLSVSLTVTGTPDDVAAWQQELAAANTPQRRMSDAQRLAHYHKERTQRAAAEG